MEARDFIERTASRKDKGKAPESRYLSDWGDVDAYVLLAEPGAGKSEAFKREAERSMGFARYVSARDLLAIGPPASWTSEQILFIDALDERRGDAYSSITALDELRKKLVELGRPKFRLSCREADWFTSGLKDLKEVAPRGEIFALWLDPLTEKQTHELLRRWSPSRLADADAFLDMAKKHNMTALLSNPLLLGMLVDVVATSSWPHSRHETYELACRKMAAEHNEIRMALAPVDAPLVDDILGAAGRLCALLLLSDAHALSDGSAAAPAGTIRIRELPREFVQDRSAARECLKSKLFLSEEGHFVPRHRTIADYLAAKFIASQISSRSLPVQRALTLMSGTDGRVVEPLRALYAWLAFHSSQGRPTLLSRDPLALILYGDPRLFSPQDKQQIFEALHTQGQRFRWFRSENWDAQPFGALGTSDMAETLRAWLTSTSRDSAHEAVLECIADAIAYGDANLLLSAELEGVVRDSTHDNEVRVRALDAWLNKPVSIDTAAAGRLLDDLHRGRVADEEDELTGALLKALYPTVLSTVEVLRYLRPERKRNFIGSYHMFWAAEFREAIPAADVELAASVLVAKAGAKLTEEDEDADELAEGIVARLAIQIVDVALKTHGETIGAEQLYRWLGVGVNQFGTFDSHEDEANSISSWLTKHPLRRRVAFEAGLEQVQPSARDGIRHFYVVEERMFRSKRPREWAAWLLEMAASAEHEDVAKYCFQEAAGSVVSRFFEHDLTIRDVEIWVDTHAGRWPSAERWKEESFSWDLNAYQRSEFQRVKKQRARAAAERGERQRRFAPHLPTLEDGAAPPWVLDYAAGAYLNRLGGIQGETPYQRLQDALVVTDGQAQRVVGGLRLVLQRPNHPTLVEILEVSGNGKRLYVSSAYLLAAKLLVESMPSTWEKWSDALQQALVAFYFADEDKEPSWYRALALAKPALVAGVLAAFAKPDMARTTNPQLHALYALRKEDAPLGLAQAVVPVLWRLMPPTPTEGQLRFFETVVLPASQLHLGESVWRELLEEKLSDVAKSGEFAVSVNLAAARFDAERHCRVVAELCECDPILVDVLANSLSNRARSDIDILATVPELACRLVRLLATGTPTDRPDHVYSYSAGDRRRDSAEALLRAVAASSTPVSAWELRRLRDAAELAPWAVYLDSLMYEHARLMNLATYRPASTVDVVRVLTNGPPSNARDMAELTRDHFVQLAKKIAYEESDLIRMFYRESGSTRKASQKPTPKLKVTVGSPKKALQIPRIENECRDFILGLVNERLLPLGVQFGREAAYARDTRADMQASSVVDGRRIIVPIEVKKDDHPRVWTAWHEQLEARYMSNPDAQGIGMYLVLWFGHNTKPSPNGAKPRNAQEMAQMMNALIPEDRRNRIIGLVVDLSWKQK